MNRIEKIKTHWNDHKHVYFAVGGGVIVGAACVALGTTTRVEGKNVATAIFSPLPQFNQTTIKLVERSTPSKPVHLVGTQKYWDSISAAARDTGHYASEISRNVNGQVASVKGNVFELVDVGA